VKIATATGPRIFAVAPGANWTWLADGKDVAATPAEGLDEEETDMWGS
jgi:hypothetical protein